MVFAVSDLVAVYIQEFDVPFGACIVRYDSAGLVEVGYEVFGDIPDAHGVFLSRIPAGWAAKTSLIVGSYQEMLEARRAVTDWCAQAGQALTGDSWSVDSKTTSALFFRVREGQ